GATDPDNRFNVTVYRDNPEPGEDPEELESYVDLSMDPADPRYVESVVNSLSTYVRAAVNTENTNQINGYSESGEVIVDGAALLGTNQRQFRINLNGDGFRTVDLTAQIDADTPDLADPLEVAATIEAVIQGLTPLRESTGANVYTGATVSFTETTAPDGVFRITVGGAASAASSVLVQDGPDPLTNAAGALSLGPRNGGTEVYGSSAMRPQDTPATDFYFLGDDTVAGAVSDVVPGTDGSTPQDVDYIAAL
ncbi:MAG: hypothetical protein GWN71_08495, partial [Gammaproteobacteria bacterium]|nr:hypothetical protein [Gemmatimonadota bacterium]NIU73606.1 hypothetical protein [Gammaproteobacteria bacterium]